ncbi:MAG TPA: hypothetical protein VHR42_00170 [Clostridia bacterium]|nr:hypothetical protein [Clostridia bacterium]
MELQRAKLENIKTRLNHGEEVKSTRVESDRFCVQLTNGPEITVDDNYKKQVENTINKVNRGVRENTPGPDKTLND